MGRIKDNSRLEHRPYLETGTLEWNKASEKVGIADAPATCQNDYTPTTVEEERAKANGEDKDKRRLLLRHLNARSGVNEP